MITTKAVTSKEISARERRNRRLAYESAVEGIVLLENKGILLHMRIGRRHSGKIRRRS